MPIGVLYTINNLDTAGMKYVVADLVRSLDRTHFSPSIAVSKRSHSHLERELVSYCEIFEVPLRIPRRPRFAFPTALLSAAFRLRGKADIVHSFDYVSDWSEGLEMKLAGIPWLVEKTNLHWDDRKWWLRCFLADRIVCLSQAQVDLMQRWAHKIDVVPTGIDLDKFRNAIPLQRDQLGFSESHILLVSVAHLVPVKGHRELLEAMAGVVNDCPRLRLLLVGEGEKRYVESLQDYAIALGVTKQVHFLGKSEQVPSILKMCDGKILATRNEGRREAFGAALIEAMAAGIPTIATKSGGPEGIVIDGETGWLVDADGSLPLVRAIKEFYVDPGKRVRMGQAGQQHARNIYSKELMVERYSTIYMKVLEQRHQRRCERLLKNAELPRR